MYTLLELTADYLNNSNYYGHNIKEESWLSGLLTYDYSDDHSNCSLDRVVPFGILPPMKNRGFTMLMCINMKYSCDII